LRGALEQAGVAGDPDSPASKLGAYVRQRVAAIYAEEGAAQEELWCTAEQIYLF
jgi:hypothetical protein